MKGKFTTEEKGLFDALEAKKSTIQTKLDSLNKEIKAAAKVEAKIRLSVAKLKPLLVPFAEMQAGLASPVSRDKYFSHLSKNDFIGYVKKSLAKG